MFFKQLFFFLSIICISCAGEKKTSGSPIRISILKGPSAIAFAHLSDKQPSINKRPLHTDIADSPEIILSRIIKGETDIAILPMTSAANLYNKGIPYTLLGCPVWGTLFLIGSKEIQNISDLKGKTVHLFGAGTTPEILTRYILSENNPDYSGISFNCTFGNASEITQALLAHRIETAVISEPFLSMAASRDTTLHIITDLNNLQQSGNGFPQTAILINREMEPYREILDSLVQISCEYAVLHPDSAIHIVEKKNFFPAGVLSPESIQRCKIAYRPGNNIRREVSCFLNIIYDNAPKAIGNKLPDSGFIPTAP